MWIAIAADGPCRGHTTAYSTARRDRVVGLGARCRWLGQRHLVVIKNPPMIMAKPTTRFQLPMPGTGKSVCVR